VFLGDDDDSDPGTEGDAAAADAAADDADATDVDTEIEQ
jgi:hypothetical protein